MRALFFVDDRRPMPALARTVSFGLALVLLAAVCAGAFSLLHYQWAWQPVGNYWRLFRDGWLATLIISALALPLSCLIGLGFALARRSRFLPLRDVARIYVEFTRGTPLLIQIWLYWYVFGQQLPREVRLLAGALILALFSLSLIHI